MTKSWIQNFEIEDNQDTTPFDHLLSMSQPSVFWSASADEDFRPITYMYPTYQEFHGRFIGVPDLFVFSCLPYNGMYGQRIFPDRILYHDQRTTITCINILHLRINSNIAYDINPQYYRMRVHPSRHCTLAKVRLQSIRGEAYDSYVIFLHMENINTFDVLLSQDVFYLKYVCAIREGLGFGGCGKSIITHLFQDGQVKKMGQPIEYCIVWDDYTSDIFHAHIKKFYEKIQLIDHYIDRCSPHNDLKTSVYQLQNLKK